MDLVITDPAYESLEKHRAKGTTTRLKRSKASSNGWFKIFPNSRLPALLVELYRVLKTDTHFYMFSDADTMFAAKPMAEAIGFKFWTPVVWDKLCMGMGYHYRRRNEFILFFEKGKRALRDCRLESILPAKSIRDGYPTEKPAELSEILVYQSSNEGAVICDPFMGSGSVGIAALRQGRHFLGNDICAEAVAVTRKRLKLSKHRSPESAGMLVERFNVSLDIAAELDRRRARGTSADRSSHATLTTRKMQELLYRLQMLQEFSAADRPPSGMGPSALQQPPATAVKAARLDRRSIKAMRREAGLSQRQFAHLLGVSPGTVSRWESGRAKPSASAKSTLVALRWMGSRYLAALRPKDDRDSGQRQ